PSEAHRGSRAAQYTPLPAAPLMTSCPRPVLVSLFTAPATTAIYTLSLHDALPIWRSAARSSPSGDVTKPIALSIPTRASRITASDRKSTRLNSSHDQISYAVFCLKKKIFV